MTNQKNDTARISIIKAQRVTTISEDVEKQKSPYTAAAAAAAKSLQSCPTLCDPIDGSPPGSPIPGILQARTLEWVPLPSPSFISLYGKHLSGILPESMSIHVPPTITINDLSFDR